MTNLVPSTAPSVPAAMRALDAMQHELSQASTYDQISDVIHRAEVLRVLFRNVEEVEHQAQLTIVLGKRRIGEALKKVPKANKHQSSKAGKSTTTIKPTERHRMGKLADLPESVIRETSTKLQENGKDATVTAVLKEITYGDKKAHRASKVSAIAAKALPAGLFNVGVADPPWRTETWSDRGMDRSADNHYPTMSLEDIMAMDVSSRMAKQALFGLWVTVPHLENGFAVLRAWGFEYKSALTWDKVVAGTGKWFMNQTEHFLLGTRGGIPAPVEDMLISSLLREKKGKHSAKPEAILDWIDRLYPAPVPKIELFRRGTARPGWVPWGNESGS